MRQWFRLAKPVQRCRVILEKNCRLKKRFGMEKCAGKKFPLIRKAWFFVPMESQLSPKSLRKFVLFFGKTDQIDCPKNRLSIM